MTLKMLDWSKFNTIVEDKINVRSNQQLKFVLGRVKNILGKGKKCWLSAFSPFSHGAMFSKAFLRLLKDTVFGKGLGLSAV